MDRDLIDSYSTFDEENRTIIGMSSHLMATVTK